MHKDSFASSLREELEVDSVRHRLVTSIIWVEMVT